MTDITLPPTGSDDLRRFLIDANDAEAETYISLIGRAIGPLTAADGLKTSAVLTALAAIASEIIHQRPADLRAAAAEWLKGEIDRLQ